MYRVIGCDKLEYGPLTADQLRLWIAEGRVNAATQVRTGDDAEWRTIGSLPELAGAFVLSPPPAPAVIEKFEGRSAALRKMAPLTAGLLVAGLLNAGFGILELTVWLPDLGGGVFFGGGGAIGTRFAAPQFGTLLTMALGGLSLISGVTGVAAWWCIKRLKFRALCLIACVLVLLPTSPAWLLGLPCGFWGFDALCDPVVKKSFDS